MYEPTMSYEDLLEKIKGRTIIELSDTIKDDTEKIGSVEIDGLLGMYLTLDDGRVLTIWVSEFGEI